MGKQHRGPQRNDKAHERLRPRCRADPLSSGGAGIVLRSATNYQPLFQRPSALPRLLIHPKEAKMAAAMNFTQLTRAGALLAINLLFLMVWGFAGLGKVASGV